MTTSTLPEIPSSVETAPPPEAAEDFVITSSMDQQRWWALDQLAPDNPALNVPFAVELIGPLNSDVLQKALQSVILRHEALRTTFAWLEGEVKQVIAPDAAFKLQHKNLSTVPEDQRPARLQQEMIAEAQRPMPLTQAPLLRALLLHFDDEKHVLVFTLHHIICDGWANGVILREMGIYYRAILKGKSAELPELPIQYADYALWQRDWMKTPDFETQLAFWVKLLEGKSTMLDFPTDYPRKSGPGHKFPGFMENYLLPLRLTDELKRMCRDFDGTLYMLFFATFASLLHRYTGQTRFIVGTTMANRPRPELENLVGQFANPMMLRIDLEDQPTFRELVHRVRDMLLGAMSHQDVPLESILERLEINSKAREKPAIQAIIMFQRDFMQPAQSGELDIRPLRWVSPGVVTEFTLGIVERAEGICLHLEYNTSLFENATIQRMLRHFEKLLEAFVEDPDTLVSELSILTEAERSKLWPPLPSKVLSDGTQPSSQSVVKNLQGQLNDYFQNALEPSGALIKPPSDVLLVVLDRHLRLLPPGAVGQLYLGGVSLEVGSGKHAGFGTARFIVPYSTAPHGISDSNSRRWKNRTPG